MGNSDRRPYETATALTQDLLDDSQDNLVNQFEMIVDIETPNPGEVLHLSDRNKYVGQAADGSDPGIFYEARLVFPLIKKSIGEFLSPAIKFSNISLTINNADGKYNRLLPAGADYDGWIGRKVTVKLGLRDLTSSYITVFEGSVSPQGGFQRSTKDFTLVARNKFEELNKRFPTAVFKQTTFPDLEENYENVIIPYIYGDWNINVEPLAASIPATPINGANVNVNGGDDDTPGDHTVAVEVVISQNDNQAFDDEEVYIQRGDAFFKFDPADIFAVNAAQNQFSVRQSGTTPAAVTQVEGSTFEFKKGDRFLVKVTGKDIGATYTNNAVQIARDVLETFGGAAPADFSSKWNTLRDKTTPTESGIANIAARAWIQEPIGAMDFALSLLEQVRVEIFTNRDQEIDLSTLHFDDFVASPTFNIRNWDLERPTFKPRIDDRTNINRAKAVFNFLPNRKETFFETATFRNDDAINQSGVEVAKKLVFPNLFATTDAKEQLIETLRLASSTPENINVNVTWRSILLDVGDFVKLNVEIAGTLYRDVPCLVREIGYDPNGIKLPLRLWSFQMTPFPGYVPGFPGTVGGFNQTINEE